MKVLSVLGSPRRNGNTSALLDEFLKGITENHDGVEISKVFLQELEIKGCMGCNSCHKKESTGCVIKDDMGKLYPMIDDSEVIILSTPVYWWNMSSQLKTFIDRIYGFKGTLKGKKMILLTTFGDDDKITSGALNIINSLKSMCQYEGIEFLFDYGVSSYKIPVNENKEVLKEVYELGRNI